MPRQPGGDLPIRELPVRSLRLTALAGCCALVLACASIAVAKPGHEGGGQGHGAGAQPVSETGESPQGAGQGGRGGGNSDQGGGGSGEHGHSHGEHGDAGHGEHGHGEHGGVGPGEHGHSEHPGHGEHGGGQSEHGGGGAGKFGAGEGSGKASNGNGRPHAHGSRSQSRASTAGASLSVSGGASGAPTASAASVPTAPSAPAAPAAASVQPVAASTVVAPRPAGSSSHSQSVTRARRARAQRRVRAGRSGVIARAALPSAVAAVSLVTASPDGSAGSGARQPASRGARHTAQASAQPPIVQTITRIVGVIPLAVWIALGALLALALALAAGSRLLAKHARRLERQRGELLADVGLLQTTLLPAPAAGRGSLRTSAAHRPADGPAAGGDFYDVFALEDGGLATIVGDVCGHGREALPHTALVRFTLRAYLEAGLSPREALRTAGAVLERQLDGALATVVLATYQPRERTLVYACAGHPPPVVLGSRALEPLGACAAPPIGAGMPTGTRQSVIALPGAAQVCFHTDGVTDARVGSDLYGSDRLERALASLGAAASAPALLDRVAEQTDSRPDDMAVCLLSLQGNAAEPVTLVQELELYDDGTARERAERFLLACGLDLRESARIAAAAREEVARAGSVLLQARPAGAGVGAPSARIGRDDLPDIHASDTRRLATVGAAR